MTSAESNETNTAVPEGTISRAQRIDRALEVIVAIMLGVVAVATAWSGYQAARWGGEQSRAPCTATPALCALNQFAPQTKP